MDTQMQPGSENQITKSKNHDKWLHKSIFFLSIAIVLVLSIWLVTRYIFPVKSKGFQAVFLSNGQTYYGHLQANLSADWINLSDIYYIQLTEGQESTDENQATKDDFVLIKLGGELHGPHDTMRINKEHILYIEDLREDSDLVQSMRAFEAQ